MTHELLVPVGDYECLLSAIHNGADAVYLGGKRFGARKFANNFTDEELIMAIKTCHLYGVKIYITVNTIIYEDEINDFIKYIEFLYLNNVDAVIMQDIGMISLVRKLYPNLVIHASTQMHNHNTEQLKLLSELGVKRVVLARELSLDTIKKIDTKLELEVFIHGALCICYSGQCLFSSLIFNRSGNRGECAGICRLPYQLLKNEGVYETNGDYLLSPKEVCTIDKFKELLDSNITSFKIEGRMKSATYVGYVTRLYRKLMNYQNVTKEEIDNLKIIYNREFTNGHLFNDRNENLMNITNPNHQGLLIGKVIDSNKKFITIKLNHSLNQEDGIRFSKSKEGMIVNFLYNEKELLINKASSGDIIKLDNRLNIAEKEDVLLTSSKVLTDLISNTPEKKIPIIFKMIAHLNEPIMLMATDGVNRVELTGPIAVMAKNAPITNDKIINNIDRLKDTPFVLEQFDTEIDDNIFIVISELNELRRKVVEELVRLRANISYDHPINDYRVDNNYKNNNSFLINILVRNEEQLKWALTHELNNIYVTDYQLYLKYKNLDNVFLRLNRVINNHSEINNARLLIGESGSIKYAKNNLVNSDYYLNVVNSYTINYLQGLGINLVTLSVEMSLNQIRSINNLSKYNTEVIIYGTPEVMVMKHCLINHLVNKEKTCNACINSDYSLLDRNNHHYPIINDETHLTHIMNCNRINRISEIGDLKTIGVKAIRIELLNETIKELDEILNDIYRKL